VISQLYNLIGSEAADEFRKKAADASSIERPDQANHPLPRRARVEPCASDRGTGGDA
jgi:hypothetical protein